MKPKNSILKETRDTAAVGIGTMIVFIATVLVAAIAAGVLIDMSGKLQSQSQATGTQATEQVASNIEFRQIVGKIATAGDGYIDEFEIFVGLAAGANEVDLAQSRLIVQNGTNLATLSHSDATQAAMGETAFNATEERDVGGGFTSASPVMTPGDLVRLETDNPDEGYPTRDDITVTLTPETGADAVISFRTPNSYGQDTVIPLA